MRSRLDTCAVFKWRRGQYGCRRRTCCVSASKQYRTAAACIWRPVLLVLAVLVFIPHTAHAQFCSADQESLCSLSATCHSTGSGPNDFVCTCDIGYTGNGRACTKITCNPPIVPNAMIQPTKAPGEKFNFNDALIISCSSGYSPPVARTVCEEDDIWDPPIVLCTDVDECSTGTHGCAPPAECNNTVGSYQCLCDIGFEPNGTHCRPSDVVCPPLAGLDMSGRWVAQPATINVVSGSVPFGSRVALECTTGFASSQVFNLACNRNGLSEWQRAASISNPCQDIDECRSLTAPCGVGTCSNQLGTFACICPSGYGTTGLGATCQKLLDSTPTGTSTPAAANAGPVSTPILIILVVVATVIVVFFVVVIVVIIVSRRQDTSQESSENISGVTNADYGSPQHIIAGKRLSNATNYANDVPPVPNNPLPMSPPFKNGSISSSQNAMSPVLATPDSVNSGSVFFFPPGMIPHQLTPQQQQQLFIQQQQMQQQQRMFAAQARRGQDVAPYHTSELISTLGRHGTTTSELTQSSSLSNSSGSEGRNANDIPPRTQSPTGRTMGTRLSTHYILPTDTLLEEPKSPAKSRKSSKSSRSPDYDVVSV